MISHSSLIFGRMRVRPAKENRFQQETAFLLLEQICESFPSLVLPRSGSKGIISGRMRSPLHNDLTIFKSLAILCQAEFLPIDSTAGDIHLHH
jgi:hypothetical protein